VLTEFKTHIKNNFSNLLESKCILACSGGLDSVVLAHLFNVAGVDFDIAHCNFQLRGSESDGDEQFVRTLAISLTKKIHVTKFDTNSYVLNNKVNIQVAARELRYAWFAEIMQDNVIDTLVTAHHADDNLETFVINLSRGTGIEGLTGIPEKTDTISRPLLPFSRTQILEYAEAENLTWREDKSNNDTKYLRNKIRQEIIPLLKELHPTFLDNFNMTSSYLSDSNQLLNNHVELLRSRCFESTADGIRISIAELMVLRPLKGYLHALLKNYGFTAWDDIEKLLKGISGKEVRSKTHRLLKDREYLLLAELKAENDAQYVIQEGQSEVETPFYMNITEVVELIEVGKNILYLDKVTLNYPLTVRKWEKGDYFYPFGMSGKKKLSKYFKDEKIDVLSKEKQWLLCSGDAIVWVIGKRADQRFSVTAKTKQILKLTIHE
jgi:tRNA(Ile)-lysidine synthase